MISINRKRTKNVLLIFLILIVLILVGLTFYYSGYIEVFRNIVNGYIQSITSIDDNKYKEIIRDNLDERFIIH